MFTHSRLQSVKVNPWPIWIQEAHASEAIWSDYIMPDCTMMCIMTVIVSRWPLLLKCFFFIESSNKACPAKLCCLPAQVPGLHIHIWKCWDTRAHDCLSLGLYHMSYHCNLDRGTKAKDLRQAVLLRSQPWFGHKNKRLGVAWGKKNGSLRAPIKDPDITT